MNSKKSCVYGVCYIGLLFYFEAGQRDAFFSVKISSLALRESTVNQPFFVLTLK